MLLQELVVLVVKGRDGLVVLPDKLNLQKQELPEPVEVLQVAIIYAIVILVD